jgi:hydroxyethylthiazole kinase
LANGHPLMGRVTALGCALSAIAAGFAALTPSAFEAAAAAVAVFGIAGETAAERGDRIGSGSYRVRFIDQLGWVEAKDITRRLKLVSDA